MDISTLSVGRSGVSPFEELRAKRKKDDESPLPSSWGEDRVSISDEARSASAAAEDTANGAKDKDKSEAATAFAEYTQESRSKAQTSGSPEERLKDLQDKLKSLQSQVQQVASSDTLPEEVKQTRIADINAQVSAVMSQISELTAQINAEKKQA